VAAQHATVRHPPCTIQPVRAAPCGRPPEWWSRVIVANIIKNNTKKMRTVGAAPCGRPTRHGTTPAVYHATRMGGPMWPPNTPRYDTRREPYNPYGRPHVAAHPNGGPVWPPRNIIKNDTKKMRPVRAAPCGRPHTMWPPDMPCYDTNRSTYNPYGRPHVAAPPEWRPHV